ncbi:MAG: hypothetical protein LBF76_02275 [Holosporales bacterium]|nr:hypothetical protein [Holosporales bacterium]
MKKPKNQIRFLIGGVLGVPGLLIALTFWADPLQIFHDQPLERPVYVVSGGGHWERPGAIQRHFLRRRDKETVIVGTCLNMNILPEEAERLGGFKGAVNLSAPCTVAYEMRAIYNMLLDERSSVKIVLQSLDPEYYFYTPIPRKFLKSEHYISSLSLAKFFDSMLSILDCKLVQFLEKFYIMMQFCCTHEAYNRSIEILFYSLQKGFPKREETLYATSYLGLAAFLSHKNKLPNKEVLLQKKAEIAKALKLLNTHSLVELQEMFSYNLYEFDFIVHKVARYPDVLFYFFIPPYCGYNADFTRYVGGILCFLSRIEAFPNIHLYAFDDVQKIVGNTANYWDATHYGIGVNRYILRSLKAGKHQITKANVLAYLRRMAEVLVAFDPTPDYTHTVSFEGPLNEETEKAFAAFPPPMGPEPLLP